MGCQLTYQQDTWVDLLVALRQGEVDMLLGNSGQREICAV